MNRIGKLSIISFLFFWMIFTSACEEPCISEGMEKMSEEIRYSAEARARKSHILSNLKGCEFVDDEVHTSDSKTSFSRVYKCRLVGKLLGQDHYEVLIKVEGTIKNCQGTVYGASVISDKKVY